MIFIKNKVINTLGLVVTLMCFGFIGKMIFSIEVQWSKINSFKTWSTMILTAAIGAIFLLIVAYAWSILVEFIENRGVNKVTLISIYIKSNLAKYLPGNIMNLVGRNVLAGKLGYKQMSIATSSIIEICTFGFTTMMLSIVFSVTKLKELAKIVGGYVNYSLIRTIIIVGIIILCLFVGLLASKKEIKNKVEKYFTFEFFKLCMKLVFLYSVYFIFLGSMLFFVLNYILDVNIGFQNFAQVLGYYIISYFIGYITPGSPGGMGVRETVLIVLLKAITGNNIATIAAIIHRVITIIADIIIYSVCNLFIKNDYRIKG